jgi:hypothetical protein
MDTIAPLANASNTLDTFAKYVRVMEKAGVNFDQFTLPINNRAARRNLADFLKAGCPKLTIPTNGVEPSADMTGYELASAILGKDFITPEEIVSARPGIVYTEAQLEEFESTLPPREELDWLRENGFMLVAGPPRPMSLLEIRDIRNEYLHSKTGGWYSNDKEKFSRDHKATTKWLKLRKGPVPNSTRKNWNEQQPLLSDVEYVPNAAEAVWGVTSYKAVRGVYLLPNVCVWTSSLDSDGLRIYVGYFDAKGLNVHYYWDDLRYDVLGLVSARK